MRTTTARFYHPPLRHQAGDTIVEVIIAIAVIATMLAGAFAVVTNSTHGVRDAEEHAQALQFLQGQVELLRNAAGQSGILTAGLNQAFCLYTDSSGVHRVVSSDSHCLVSGLYNLSITSPTATPIPGSTTTFNLVATWPSVSGNTDTVLLSYKVAVTT
ncbi:MAG TPA: type II secretion system protein [Candidatus Saccharimonadales bacterium]|nr:type II secretion system protein [Candidatus Saccharimonadales bacterium]